MTFNNIEHFQSVFKSHYNELVNYVYSRYMHDWDAARDVVQTTFLKIWKNREKIEITTSIKSYLYRAAKNTALDEVRKNKNKFTVDPDEGLKNVPSDDIDFSEEEQRSFLIRTHIKEALLTLKPKARKIFELHKFEGLTYQEISDHMGISKRTVESNMANSLVRLRKTLEEVLKKEF